MRGIAVDVGGIRLRSEEFLRGIERGAVIVALRSRSRLTELVPSSTDPGLGEQRVVEHGAGVVEAPIRDPDQDIRTGISLWQVDPPVDAIHTRGRTHPVQVGLHLAGQFRIVQTCQFVQPIELVDVHAEGPHRTDPCAPHDRWSIGRTTLLNFTSQEAHHAAAVDVGSGVTTLGEFRELVCVGLLSCQCAQVLQIGQGGGWKCWLGVCQ